MISPTEQSPRFVVPLSVVTAMMLALLAMCSLISGCTSGTSSGNGSGTTVPPIVVFTTSSIQAAVGVAITPVTPTVTGTVTGFTISPALPAGLALNASTGAISGTPTQVTSTATYVVTATNSAGSGTASIQITVAIAAPSNLAYPQTSITATIGTAITPDTPTVTGTVTGYTINPALPAGLAITATTGAISGTPTAASTSATYTVTASNGSGSATATVQIAVNHAAPSYLIYAQSSFSATVGTLITPDTPIVTGTVTSYTIAPVLPPGLTISATTGTISGTPTVAVTTRSYTVTASNESGSTTATLSILITPPNLVFNYPQRFIQAVIGTPIAPDTPIVSEGRVSSYSIGQLLPGGLTFDALTGTISGTPTTASSKKTYTVSATGDLGASGSATLQIAVTPPSSVSITYPQTWITTTVGTAISPDVPTVTGALSTFTISPALPAGLNLDPATGIISGTPTAVSHAAAYTITASGSGGTATTTINIAAVTIQTLLDLGPTSPASLAITSDRVLAADTLSAYPGKWVLWDYPAGNVLAKGGIIPSLSSSSSAVAMAGGLAIVPTTPPEVHSSADGSLLFTIDGFTALAPDGSYIYYASANGLEVWSAGGTLEFTLPGDYSRARLFASPTQLQIANSPYGNNVIETVQVSGASVSVSPIFNGTFVNWFSDGQRFLTNQANAVWIYSNAGNLQYTYSLSFITTSVQNGGGYGNWFWVTSSGAGELFQVGNTTLQLTGFLLSVVSGPILAALDPTNPLVTIYDLSGTTVGSSVNALPSIEGSPTSFAAYTPTQWVVSNQYGLVLDGGTAGTTPHTFNYGRVLGIAGSSTYAAVETANGQMLIFDASGTKVNATNFAPASISISQNGSTLGSLTSKGVATFYALPSMNLLAAPAGTTPSINLAANGQYAGLVFASGNSTNGEVFSLTGSNGSWSVPVTSGTQAVFPSPDGLLLAVPVSPDGEADQNTTTNIYQPNGTLVAIVIGNPEGWIDSNSLLVGTYQQNSSPNVKDYYVTSIIVDGGGNLKFTFPQKTLPALTNPQFLSSNEVYQDGTVYSLATGAVDWYWPGLENANGTFNAFAGSGVIYTSAGQVNLIPR